MPGGNDYSLTAQGLRNYIRDEKEEEFIYSCTDKEEAEFRYNNDNGCIEHLDSKGNWEVIRGYCLPPYKKEYGDEIKRYYQVVRENLMIIFEELKEGKQLTNADIVTKEVADLCSIADYALTLLSAQVERAIDGADDGWTDDGPGFKEMLTSAMKEVRDKTLDISGVRQKKDDEVVVKSFLERIEDLLDLPGDYFADNRPAWDAMMKKVNKKIIQSEGTNKKNALKKLSKVMEEDGEIDVTEVNSEILKYGGKMLLYYKAQIVLNTFAAEIMQQFMVRGLSVIENPKTLIVEQFVPRLCRGILNLVAAPIIANRIKEKLQESIDLIITAIKKGKVPDLKGAIKIPEQIITNAYKDAIDYYDLADKFGPVDNLYLYYEEKIRPEDEETVNKYGFLAAHKIDAPDISLGLEIVIEDLPRYIGTKALSRLHNLYGDTKNVLGKMYSVGATCERITETIERYNTDQVDFNKLEAVISDLEGIKQLHEYREEDIPFIAMFDVDQEEMKQIKKETNLFLLADPFNLNINNEYETNFDLIPGAKQNAILQKGIIKDGKVRKNKRKFCDKVKDIKFPGYKPNYHTIYGSGKVEEDSEENNLEPFEFLMGNNTDGDYLKESNPDKEIKINQEKIGENIKTSDKYLEQLEDNYGRNAYTELYVEEDFDNNFKLIYQFTPDYDSPDQHKLKIYYGPTSQVKKKLDYLINPGSRATNPDVDELTIENFQNGDYGICLPRCHRLYGSLNNKAQFKGSGELKQFTIYDYRRQEEKKYGGPTIEVELGANSDQETLELGINLQRRGKILGEQEKVEYEDENGVYYLYYVDEGKVKIKYGNNSWERNKELYPRYGNSIVIENYCYGDFNLYLELEEAIFFGSKFSNQNDERKVVMLDREEQQIDREPSSKKQDDQQREYKFAPGQPRNHVHYQADKEDKIAIKYFKRFKNIGELDVEYRYDFEVKSDQDVLWEGYKSELKKAKTRTIFYKYIENRSEGRYELIIRYYNSDDYEEQKIRIKEFQNGDYGIELPPIKIDELPGGKVVK